MAEWQEVVYDLSNGTIFNDLEWPLNQILRAPHTIIRHWISQKRYNIDYGYCRSESDTPLLITFIDFQAWSFRLLLSENKWSILSVCESSGDLTKNDIAGDLESPVKVILVTINGFIVCKKYSTYNVLYKVNYKGPSYVSNYFYCHIKLERLLSYDAECSLLATAVFCSRCYARKQRVQFLHTVFSHLKLPECDMPLFCQYSKS